MERAVDTIFLTTIVKNEHENHTIHPSIFTPQH